MGREPERVKVVVSRLPKTVMGVPLILANTKVELGERRI